MRGLGEGEFRRASGRRGLCAEHRRRRALPNPNPSQKAQTTHMQQSQIRSTILQLVVSMDDPVQIHPFIYIEMQQHMPDKLQCQSLPSFGGMNFLTSGCNKQACYGWFDVKVFYVRVSSCLLNEVPDTLLIVYPKRDIDTELEINGGRISPSERVCFALRGDRVDTDSAEATYVNTNNLRTTGDLSFEIYDKDELLVLGVLARSKPKEHQLAGNGSCSMGTSPLNFEAGWSMDCSCAVTSNTCSFLKGRSDVSTANPTMEVYVAGRSSEFPIVLTQIVPLAAKKKSSRCCSLHSIPEEEESTHNEAEFGEVANEEAYPKLEGGCSALGIPNSSLYFSDLGGYGEGDGELSWFNAGVRVGVGLGLGMCLGVGIGVGLMMRTYQATMGPFKRRMF
ncbi:hypothetical protein GOP47_0014924 [Adiantum capillus-veneris]|uniref:Uncharacterized protein n=1 Tax=Adiantum capillus-veneris TaxID=13818 RepID=A0A9D4UMF9_ADICA|nr:hypothetical protein GOP47_0014924 [Adiantum capillus-veneris]